MRFLDFLGLSLHTREVAGSKPAAPMHKEARHGRGSRDARGCQLPGCRQGENDGGPHLDAWVESTWRAWHSCDIAYSRISSTGGGNESPQEPKRRGSSR